MNMKRWLPIIAILAAGIIGAILLSRPDAPFSPAPSGTIDSNALARVRVSGGGSHALAIAPDGSLWSWGENSSALGLRNLASAMPRPTRVGTNSDWAKIDAGYTASFAIKQDGSLWVWGSNPSGMLGNSNSLPLSTPTLVGTDHDWIAAGPGLHHSAGLKRDGSIWTWGANNFGQLGRDTPNGATSQSFVPAQVGSETNWKSLAVGALHNVAIKTDGTLWTWGDSGLGPVTANHPSNNNTPVKVGTETNWIALASGQYHTLALRSDGTLWHWGRNAHLLGGIPPADPSKPRQLGTNTNWTAIYSGAYHNLARRADGSVWQLGRLNGGFSGEPVITHVGADWVAVGGGERFSLAVAQDGSLWHWGAMIGAKKEPWLIKRIIGGVLTKFGVQNNFNQSTTPDRLVPEKIFQLPFPSATVTNL